MEVGLASVLIVLLGSASSNNSMQLDLVTSGTLHFLSSKVRVHRSNIT